MGVEEMLPAEKANRLVHAIFFEIKEVAKSSGRFEEISYRETAITSKRCALIAVEEIIKVFEIRNPIPGATYSNPGKFYWMQVKIEIEKL